MVFTTPLLSAQEDPELLPDESWLSLSDSAVDAKPDRYSLDYGKGTVLVEMDDWNWYPDGYGILEADSVTELNEDAGE